MLRIAIRATPDTDVDAEAENLRRAAENAGVEPALIQQLVHETNSVVRDFVKRGRELKGIGSNLKAERAIRGNGYDIRVSFDTVERSGMLDRLRAMFGR